METQKEGLECPELERSRHLYIICKGKIYLVDDKLPKGEIGYPFDVYQDANHNSLHIEIPSIHVTKDEIKVHAAQNNVAVQCLCNANDKYAKEYFHKGTKKELFSFNFLIGSYWNPMEAFASLEKGLLQIIIPRHDGKYEYRKINIHDNQANNSEYYNSVELMTHEQRKQHCKEYQQIGNSNYWKTFAAFSMGDIDVRSVRVYYCQSDNNERLIFNTEDLFKNINLTIQDIDLFSFNKFGLRYLPKLDSVIVFNTVIINKQGVFTNLDREGYIVLPPTDDVPQIDELRVLRKDDGLYNTLMLENDGLKVKHNDWSEHYADTVPTDGKRWFGQQVLQHAFIMAIQKFSNALGIDKQSLKYYYDDENISRDDLPNRYLATSKSLALELYCYENSFVPNKPFGNKYIITTMLQYILIKLLPLYYPEGNLAGHRVLFKMRIGDHTTPVYLEHSNFKV